MLPNSCLAFFAGMLCILATQAQTLKITPDRTLADQTVNISVSGLQPHETVTIKADMIDGGDHQWESHADFVADDQGNIEVAKQAPTKGSYKDVSAMGLVWSMKPTESGVAIYRAPPKFAPQLIHLALVRDGTPLERTGRSVPVVRDQVSTAQLQQDAIATGVRQINVSGKLHGILFVPAGDGAHPAVLVVGGSEGGLPSRKAAWLASHGFAAFALAYFHYEGLPEQLQAIPLEYFGEALGWMMSRPEVAPNRIAVMGTSRGGELALQLGSMYPEIKAVVAYVPANVRYPAFPAYSVIPFAWTVKGQPLAFARPGRHTAEDMRAEIRAENTKGPILMIGGGQDHVWDSSGMVAAVVSRLKRANFQYSVVGLIYPHAGHIAGRPEIVPEWHGAIHHAVTGQPMDYGGTPEGNAESSIDAIPKVLEFLAKSL